MLFKGSIPKKRREENITHGGILRGLLQLFYVTQKYHFFSAVYIFLCIFKHSFVFKYRLFMLRLLWDHFFAFFLVDFNALSIIFLIFFLYWKLLPVSDSQQNNPEKKSYKFETSAAAKKRRNIDMHIKIILAVKQQDQKIRRKQFSSLTLSLADFCSLLLYLWIRHSFVCVCGGDESL